MAGKALSASSELCGKCEPLPEFQRLHDMFAALISSADKQRDDAFLDGTALFCDGARVTFRELDRRSNRLARRLAGKIGECADVAATASRDKVVVVDMAPSERLVVALFAVMKIDVAYLPVDPGFPAAHLAYVVNDARPLCILADRRGATLADAERQFAAPTPVFTYDELAADDDGVSAATLKPDERLPHDYRTPLLACVLYTSGSEGRPKGVRLPHKVIMNRLCWQWSEFPFAADDEIGCFKTSTTFVDHLQEVFGALLRGVPVVVVAAATTRDPRALVDVLESRGVTRIVLVPSLLRMLLAFLPPAGTGKPRLPRLRLWVCSGETLSAELLREFFVRFPSGRTICNFYGSTEVTGDVTYATFESASGVGDGVPIGRPIYNTIVYLLDDAMTVVARGERGEMYVAGLSVAAGYVGAAEENARRFLRNSFCDVPGYCALFRTGDFARVDDDGSLVFEGRTDAQVKVRGHRVDLSEIENAARQFPGIDKLAVLCHDAGEATQAIVAYYTSAVAIVVDDGDLADHLANNLPSYMLPDAVRVDDLPFLVNGKIDRQQLRRRRDERRVKRAADLSSTSDLSPAARAAAAAVLAAAAAVLALPAGALCLGDNFFEVGGDSVMAAIFVGRLGDAGFAVSIADFVAAPTLRHVALAASHDDAEVVAAGDAWYEVVAISARDGAADTLANIAADSFIAKGDMESQLVHAGLTRQHFLGITTQEFLDVATRSPESFVVVDGDGRVVAGTINFDLENEPPAAFPGVMAPIEAMLVRGEASARREVARRGIAPGRTLHCFVMATDVSLGFAENVRLIGLMEEETLRLAARGGYAAVLTVNTNRVTQEICKALGYEMEEMVEYCTFEFEGRRPFSSIKPGHGAIGAVKYL